MTLTTGGWHWQSGMTSIEARLMGLRRPFDRFCPRHSLPSFLSHSYSLGVQFTVLREGVRTSDNHMWAATRTCINKLIEKRNSVGILLMIVTFCSSLPKLFFGVESLKIDEVHLGDDTCEGILRIWHI